MPRDNSWRKSKRKCLRCHEDELLYIREYIEEEDEAKIIYQCDNIECNYEEEVYD